VESSRLFLVDVEHPPVALHMPSTALNADHHLLLLSIFHIPHKSKLEKKNPKNTQTKFISNIWAQMKERIETQPQNSFS